MSGSPSTSSRVIKVYSFDNTDRIKRAVICFGAELLDELPPVDRQVWAAADTQKAGAVCYVEVDWDYEDVLVVGPDHRIVPVPEGARRVNIPMHQSLHSDQALAILLNEYRNDRN